MMIDSLQTLALYTDLIDDDVKDERQERFCSDDVNITWKCSFQQGINDADAVFW